MNVKTVSGRGVSGPPGQTLVYVDGTFIGAVVKSDRRWRNGYEVHTADGRDLGDQPRRADAVDTLVAFVTSPLRRNTLIL